MTCVFTKQKTPGVYICTVPCNYNRYDTTQRGQNKSPDVY